MSLREVAWRIGQKYTEHRERRFACHPIAVTAQLFNSPLKGLKMDAQKLGISFERKAHSTNDAIHLPGGYDYAQYATRWHAGFQTAREWPRTFAYDLGYKQNDAVGDARTNWELNRHFQFALWAKNYYFTREDRYKEALITQWTDWCEANPFLIGISWTSVMEVAIRAINWMYMLAFMKASGSADPTWEEAVTTGILNMLDYVSRHRSRFSSANNHLLVESAALAIGGYAFDHAPWRKAGIRTLTEELPRQTTDDGVNREMSLHYHAFVMEAYSLTAHIIQTNRDVVPQTWMPCLQQMSVMVCHCIYDEYHALSFGDDDEGKIIDLQGGEFPYLDYVLQLSSLVTGQRYSRFATANDTVRCLFDDTAITHLTRQPIYDTQSGHCFAQGGFTFLRSDDKTVLLGIDHGPLGFGSIAAHGHADALSFQLLAGGFPLFTDPGTYIYHIDQAARDTFRKTINHNTLSIGGADQSEMLGAFLWGKKAHCRLLSHEHHDGHTILTAEHDGYAPITHRRTFDFDHAHKRLTITDELSEACDAILTFMIGAGASIRQEGHQFDIDVDGTGCRLSITAPTPLTCLAEPAVLSPAYGIRHSAQAIRGRCHGRSITSVITIRS